MVHDIGFLRIVYLKGEYRMSMIISMKAGIVATDTDKYFGKVKEVEGIF
jgi:hypothetical protein